MRHSGIRAFCPVIRAFCPVLGRPHLAAPVSLLPRQQPEHAPHSARIRPISPTFAAFDYRVPFKAGKSRRCKHTTSQAFAASRHVLAGRLREIVAIMAIILPVQPRLRPFCPNGHILKRAPSSRPEKGPPLKLSRSRWWWRGGEGPCPWACRPSPLP